MGDLGAGAAKIVPHTAQDGFDLGVALLGEGGAQIGLAGAMLRQPRSDGAHERAAEIGDPDTVAAMDDGEQQRRRAPGRGIERRFQPALRLPPHPLPVHRQGPAQRCRITLPNT